MVVLNSNQINQPALRRYHAAIFDMDGLLLDTERIGLTVFHEVCAHFDIGDQTPLFMKLIGTNHVLGESLMREALHGVMDHTLFREEWSERYTAKITQEPVPLMDGVIELLAYLTMHRVPCAVATSTRSDVAARKLQNAGILQHFQFIVGGEQVRSGKPDPEPYLRAVQDLGLSPQDCIALEDSDNGVRSAVAAGLKVFQVPDIVPPSDELLSLGHAVFTSLRDVHVHLATTGDFVKQLGYSVKDVIPDVRDGLTRKERAVLYCLREAQQELNDRNVPTIMLYGRVIEKADMSQREFQEILTRMVGKI